MEHPIKLISLWHMLNQIDGGQILTTIAHCSNMQKKLEQAYEYLLANEGDANAKPVVLSIAEWKDLIQAAHQIGHEATKLGLPGIPKSCADLIHKVHELDGTNGILISEYVYGVQRYLETMLTSFINAMSDVSIMVLTTSAAHYTNAKAPLFGEAVDAAFPLAAEDISEAGRALGLGLNTAVAFHLMRAMESAVQALANKLGIDNTDRVWGNLLSDIERGISAMPKGKNRNQWSKAHAHLYHVKQAWRNDTMHPKKTYSEAEAKSVFEAVSSFMRHLAPLVVQP